MLMTLMVTALSSRILNPIGTKMLPERGSRAWIFLGGDGFSFWVLGAWLMAVGHCAFFAYGLLAIVPFFFEILVLLLA